MNFILDPSLVLYLPLYKLDGASFMSRDAYGHLCTVTGALWTPKGHYFDGTDDWITLPLFSENEGTIIIGFKTGSSVAGTKTLMCQSKGSVSNERFNLDIANGVPTIYHNRGNTQNGVSFGEVVADTRYQLAVTSDGAAWVCYLNGIIEELTINFGSNNGSWFGDLVGATHHRIGCMRYGGMDIQDYEGIIADVLYYSRALTPLEIQNNYLATKWRYQ